MYLPKSSLAAMVALMLSGVDDRLMSGTATLGFKGTTNCGCPPNNGPFAVSIPEEFMKKRECCQDTLTVEHRGKTVTVILNGVFDDGEGTQNIEMSPMAFAMIADNPTDTTIGPVTWSFNN
ncbi:hypothetical protein MSAN_01602100 [Mycena sanguinolenta]|uniref:Uncharacterized protein n=1 Tax=Mycena sanguinolenta TaxID=230812 RepID=A0A8H6Y3U1_9AGAR|nr:hypothetical protein MSAN_01602100 [Mycena sanguinolenta]